ncbi:hypothetical protein JB92DRAFT_2826752 [Gautieria morchelliformis]|nr:hypothetical protein JB92DRAFT_2826752 [Gautieria morchelliformis]
MQLLPNSSAQGNFAVSGQLWFDSPNVFIVTAPSAAFVWAPMTLMGNVASSRRFERGLAHLDGDRTDAAHSEPLRLLQLADTVNLGAEPRHAGVGLELPQARRLAKRHANPCCMRLTEDSNWADMSPQAWVHTIPNASTPDGDCEDQLESWGLTVTAHEQGDYWFRTKWSNKRINEWSSRNRLKKERAAPNGLDMEHIKGTAATRMRIPKQAYEMAWDISRINECLTTSGSDSEFEYADNDKGKRNMKGKDKAGLDKEVRKKKKGKYIGSDEKSTKESWSRDVLIMMWF